MSDKPEALLLAGQLESGEPVTGSAAAELRRLHAASQELLGALEAALKLIELVMPIEGDVTRKARAAIAKATLEHIFGMD